MAQAEASCTRGDLAISHGPPLGEEPGIGALTLPGFLAEVTARHGPCEALVEHLPGGRIERWRYEDLYARAEAVARALIACGTGRDARIGVLMSNRLEWVASGFGIALAGGTLVGLSTFSTASELAHLLRASCVEVLIFEEQVAGHDLAALLREIEPAIATAAPGALASPDFPFLGRLVMVSDGPPPAAAARKPAGVIESWAGFLARGASVPPAQVAARAASVSPADPAILFFSSGSTGRPKGILNGHRGVCLQSWRWPRIYAFKAGHSPRTWSANGLFWSGNYSLALGGTLAAGGTLVLQRTFRSAEALHLLAAERVSLPYCWPHQWAQLEAEADWAGADLSAFRTFDQERNLRGPQPSITTRWREPRATYGATETLPISTAYPVDARQAVQQGNNGPPLAGNTIRIVDPETGATLRRGETGEIAVKGPTLMPGYLGVPREDTLDDEGFYRSGDRGHIDARGRLIFAGRINDIIKTGGANVSPVEVDWVLGDCPGVRICKTTGVPHGTLGEMVVSLVVPEAGAALTAEAVIAFLRARLAAYKLPRRLLLVSEGELGLTGTAKIKPAEARALATRLLSTQALAPAGAGQAGELR